jgi:hypothetical protein
VPGGCSTCSLTSALYPQSFLNRVADEARVRSVLRETIALAEQAPVLTDHQVRVRLIALAGLARSGCRERGCADQAPAAYRLNVTPGGQPVPDDPATSAVSGPYSERARPPR